MKEAGLHIIDAIDKAIHPRYFPDMNSHFSLIVPHLQKRRNSDNIEYLNLILFHNFCNISSRTLLILFRSITERFYMPVL